MLVYPQLPDGALSQFPVVRSHRYRTLVNTAADGRAIKLADPGAETVEWQLTYCGLSDSEMQTLLQFFSDAEGSLNGFTFVDPVGNLLAWSGDLTNAVWDMGPFLTVAGGIADPQGGSNAWHLVNSGAGAQDLSQTAMPPGGYVYCLSIYARSSAAAKVTLLLGGNRYDRAVGPGWQRISCTTVVDATATAVTFGIEIGAGTTVDVYGMQAEPQSHPSAYKVSTTGGCYENARLRDDTLSVTSTGVNCHSATVNIFYASHL